METYCSIDPGSGDSEESSEIYDDIITSSLRRASNYINTSSLRRASPKQQQKPDSQIFRVPLVHNWLPPRTVSEIYNDIITSSLRRAREKEKTSPPTTQQLVAGSCAGMETKSTDLPVAVPTSPLTTIQPADASTPPLPATRDKAKSRWILEMFRRNKEYTFTMDQCEKTKKGVHPSETPLCGQHDSQAEAQSPKQQQKPDSQIFRVPLVHNRRPPRTFSAIYWPYFDESPPSYSEDVAAGDDDSVQSSHSRDDIITSILRQASDYINTSSLRRARSFGGPPSTDSGDVAASDDASVHSSDISPSSSGSSCVSCQSERSYDRDIDFKKNPKQQQEPDSQILSLPLVHNWLPPRTVSEIYRPDFDESPPSYSEDVAAGDDDSVQSSHSRDYINTSSLRRASPKQQQKPDSPIFRVPLVHNWHPLITVSEIESDFGGLFFSDSGDVAASDDGSVHSSDTEIFLGSQFSSGSSCVSRQSEKSYDRDIDFKKKSDFGGLFFSDSGDVAASDDGSVHSSDIRIFLESQYSSGSSCVSSQSERSYDRDIDFKKKRKRKASSGSSCVSRKRKKTKSYDCSTTFKKKSDFGGLFFSDSGDVAASDDGSVHSSDIRIFLESQYSSGSSCVSSQSERSYDRDIDFKKNPKQQQKPDSQIFRVPLVHNRRPPRTASERDDYINTSSLRRARSDFGGLFFSDSGDVAASDDGSVPSSDSGIFLGSRFSSGSSCVSSQSEKSNDRDIDFKKKSDFGGLFFSDSGDVAASDDGSVHSSDTDPKQQQKPDSQIFRVPLVHNRRPPRTASERDDDIITSSLRRARYTSTMNQCEETEEGVHPSETPLYGQHDSQTEAQSPKQQQKPDSQIFRVPLVHNWHPLITVSEIYWPDFDESPPPYSEDVVAGDDDSVQSSHSRKKENKWCCDGNKVYRPASGCSYYSAYN